MLRVEVIVDRNRKAFWEAEFSLSLYQLGI